MFALLFGQQQIHFDLSKVPFSYRGSLMAISLKEPSGSQKQVLTIRDISGKTGVFEAGTVFTVEFPNDPLIDYKATPSEITITSSKGKTEIVFQDRHTLRVRGNMTVRLTTVNENRWGFYTIPNQLNPTYDKSFSIISPDFNSFQFTMLEGAYISSTAKIISKTGEMVVTNERKMKVFEIIPKPLGNFEFALEEFESGWDPKNYEKPFDQCVSKTSKNFEEFRDKMPSAPSKYYDAVSLASYVDWSCFVGPTGLFKRETMLMSKNRMHNIWSWDHCFNAMALSYGHPDLAWDQFMIMFDYQDEKGNMPDFVNPVQQFFGVTKPPIHGWTIRKLMQVDGLVSKERLNEAYTVLSKQVNFWMKYRDRDGNGIPQYQGGPDSGWDNATVFDSCSYTEAPDLSAYLVLQMDVLSEIATKINKLKAAAEWKQKSDTLLNKFIARLWDGEKFVTKTVGSEEYNLKSQSLLNYLPIVLGKRLPENILKKLVNSFKTSGLVTNYGPATENPSSINYESDGYWRGPIWAPTTLIIVDGLRASGEEALASEIAGKFCNMCLKNGFGENYDALTGKPYRDPAYTWTSSVFLVLAHEYLNK